MTTANTSLAARGVGLDALAALLNGGYLRVYSGSQPATPETALGSQVKLQEYALQNPAFGASASSGSNRVATLAGVPLTCTNAATGTAGWATLVKSDGTRVVDCDLGGTAQSSTGDVQLDTTAIVAGAQGSLTACTLTEAMAA